MKDVAVMEFNHLINKDCVTRHDITRFVKWMMQKDSNLGHDPFPLHHHLADGFYRREVHLPKGHVIVGAVHTQESYAIVLKGKVLVIDEEGAREITGPCTLTQKAGKQKIGYVIEDCIWLDIHVTDKTSIEEAQAELFLDTYDDYDRLDYSRVLDENGLTEYQVWAATSNSDDMVPMPSATSSINFQIRKSDIHGQGVFATRSFEKNNIIGAARLGNNRTPLGRYTNHSANPNTVAIVSDYRIDFVATEDIEIGDEVTINYRQALDAAKELDRRMSCQQS